MDQPTTSSCCAKPYQYRPSRFVTGEIETAAGAVLRVGTELTLFDRLGTLRVRKVFATYPESPRSAKGTDRRSRRLHRVWGLLTQLPDDGPIGERRRRLRRRDHQGMDHRAGTHLRVLRLLG
jgi:hypothetical protein